MRRKWDPWAAARQYTADSTAAPLSGAVVPMDRIPTASTREYSETVSTREYSDTVSTQECNERAPKPNLYSFVRRYAFALTALA